MNAIKFTSLVVLLFFPFLSYAGPKYKIDPITIDYQQVRQYWQPKKPITEKNIKVITAPGMGCKAVIPIGWGEASEQYIDVQFTIDSKGKRYDQGVVDHKNVTDGFVKWAARFRMSPIKRYLPVDKSNKQPIISVERLYLVDNLKLCNS